MISMWGHEEEFRFTFKIKAQAPSCGYADAAPSSVRLENEFLSNSTLPRRSHRSHIPLISFRLLSFGCVI